MKFNPSPTFFLALLITDCLSRYFETFHFSFSPDWGKESPGVNKCVLSLIEKLSEERPYQTGWLLFFSTFDSGTITLHQKNFFSFSLVHVNLIFSGRSLRYVVANELDCDIVISEFEPPLRYYLHFKTNTHDKSINPFIYPGWIKYGLATRRLPFQ